MKRVARTIDIPKEFTHSKLRSMFAGYTVIGDSYGYWFPVEETKTILVSYGLDSLISDVKKHLRGNEIPEPLTIELTIGDHMCQHRPDLCAEITPESESKISAWKMMKRFYRAYVATAAQGRVSQEEANRRAAICAECPKNTDQVTEFCVGCYTRDLLAGVVQLAEGKSTPYDDRLKNCAVCHCNLKLKPWMQKDGMEEPELRDQWPEWCWMRN